jgi:RNA polymerase sigma-70 factor (ECF subfamily)
MKGVYMARLSLQEQYDKVYKYCYFKVHNADLAEDLTQDAFLRFFNQNSYVDRGKPLAYLYTIAKNLCADAYRKAKEPPLTDDSAGVYGKTKEQPFFDEIADANGKTRISR